MYMEDESQTAVITITREGAFGLTVGANFSTSNGTAVGGSQCGNGVDYINIVDQPVTFGPNATTQTVNIPLCGDLLTEPIETVNLTLTGSSIGFPSNAVLKINDTANEFLATTAVCTTQGSASPYPSTITVSGIADVVGNVRVTLYDLNNQVPDDLDFLLVSPTGRKFILMADAGGTASLTTPVTLTFSDIAGQVLPNSSPLTTDPFEPTSWEAGISSFPAPAPPAPYNEPGSTVGGAGTQTLNGTFGLTNAIGVWSLYVRDDSGSSANGCVSGGWGIEILPSTAAQASISGRVTTADGRGIRNAKVTITGNSLAEPRIASTGSFGYFTVSGLATGETYVVTVSSQRYTFSSPSRVISLVDNVVDADFVADPQEGLTSE